MLSSTDRPVGLTLLPITAQQFSKMRVPAPSSMGLLSGQSRDLCRNLLGLDFYFVLAL